MVIKLYIVASMKVLAEHYKGIEFVRLSKLPEDQKALLVQALPSNHIIKILRENELLTDCVQFKHYDAWYCKSYKPESVESLDVQRKPTTALKVAVD
ncbi:MAG TPA: hypothetical protein VIS49_13780 [Cyclobacteriaceae bacterium]